MNKESFNHGRYLDSNEMQKIYNFYEFTKFLLASNLHRVFTILHGKPDHPNYTRFTHMIREHSRLKRHGEVA